MQSVGNGASNRSRWVWFGLMIGGLALLVAGGLRMRLLETDAVNEATSSKEQPDLAQTFPGDSGIAETGSTRQQDKGRKKPSASPANTARSFALPDARTDPKRNRRGPSGADMTGDSQYPIVSADIYEWAKTKTPEELIALINENYSPPTEPLFDEDGNEIETPWESETSLKASWALALRVRDDPALYEVIRAALMSGKLTSNAASRLIEIVGLMPDQKATQLLLELVKLPEPPVSISELIRALAGRSGICESPTIDDYIAELDYREPDERGGFPWIGAHESKLPDTEVIETFVFLFDDRMSSWSEWNQGALWEALKDLLTVYRNLSCQAKGGQVEMMNYCEHIQGRLQWLANNSTDAGVKKSALRLLTVFPQGDQAYVPLLQALRDPDWQVRMTGVGQLYEFRNVPQVEVALIDIAKNDANWMVRQHAIERLPTTGPGGQEKLTLSLAWYTPDAHYMTRQEAIDMLAGCGVEALPHLERIAREDSDTELQAFAQSKIDEIKRRLERERQRAEFEKKLGPEMQKKLEEMRKQREKR